MEGPPGRRPRLGLEELRRARRPRVPRCSRALPPQGASKGSSRPSRWRSLGLEDDHVLLRHRLLRQADGFEGLVRLAVELHYPRYAAVLKLVRYPSPTAASCRCRFLAPAGRCLRSASALFSLGSPADLDLVEPKLEPLEVVVDLLGEPFRARRRALCGGSRRSGSRSEREAPCPARRCRGRRRSRLCSSGANPPRTSSTFSCDIARPVSRQRPAPRRRGIARGCV